MGVRKPLRISEKGKVKKPIACMYMHAGGHFWEMRLEHLSQIVNILEYCVQKLRLEEMESI